MKHDFYRVIQTLIIECEVLSRVRKVVTGSAMLNSSPMSCPVTYLGNGDFSFKLPADTSTTDTGIYAWHWSNKEVNREHYSNCAVVKFQGGGEKENVAFVSRPAPFIGKPGTGCVTPPNPAVEYPDPGPDVQRLGNDVAPPTGNCGAVVAGGGATGSSGGSGGKSVVVDAPRGSSAPAVSPVNAGGANAGGSFVTRVSAAVPTDANSGSGSSRLGSSATGSGDGSSTNKYGQSDRIIRGYRQRWDERKLWYICSRQQLARRF
jgi:hypothetical protein